MITGGSAGIGEAVARIFSAKGYRVALASRRIDRLDSLAADLRLAGGTVVTIQADVTNPQDIERTVSRTLAEFGQIDVLFNNAGFGRIEPLEKLDPDRDIKAQVETNLLGLILMSRAVLPHMLASRHGHIINMSSIAGLIAPPDYSVYSATKFGVRGFTEALRRELRPKGIQVSGIYPGWVRTEFSTIARIDPKTGVLTPQFLRMEACQVARAVWSLVRRPRRMLTIPWPLALAAVGAALFPTIADWVIAFMFRKRKLQQK